MQFTAPIKINLIDINLGVILVLFILKNEEVKLTSNVAVRKRIQHLQLTSDIFFNTVLTDIDACKEVVDIITGEDLNIVEVRNQQAILRLFNHSVFIDIWAVTEDDRQIGIEMHPQSNENRVKRNRYSISSMDVDTFKKNRKYDDIPDVFGIYITQGDFLHTKQGVNKVVRSIDATNKQIPNGISEYYVSLSCSGKTPEQTALFQYMVNSDGIEESIYFPNLVKRVRHLKENEGGLKIMCEIIDAIVQEERIEARIEGRLEGRLESKVELIRNLKENFALSKLANMLGLEETYVGDIIHMITMYPQESDELIVKRLL